MTELWGVKEDQLISFMIDEVYTYMREDDFQRNFFESLAEQFQAKEFLSQKQIDSLKKIYERVTYE